jgi:hypothetical protein
MAEEAEEGPPLPLHTIEGVGGRVLTPTAYLVNPGPEGTEFGKPAVSAQYVMVGDKDMQVVAATWTLWRRLELGYAVNRFALDDFDADVRATLGPDIGPERIYLHHFNARLNLVQENACGKDWCPAVTVGAHYKYNDDINAINRDLGGALTGLDYDQKDGYDFTLTASKTMMVQDWPVIVSLGSRMSRAAEFGLLGFTDDELVTFEGNIATMLTDRLVVGAEYRQKGEALAEVDGLLEQEDSWWDVHAAWICNENTTLYGVAGDAGSVMNHKDEMFWGFVLKHEF